MHNGQEKDYNMMILYAIRMGIKAIQCHLVRSLLTMLGIIIGVALINNEEIAIILKDCIIRSV